MAIRDSEIPAYLTATSPEAAAFAQDGFILHNFDFGDALIDQAAEATGAIAATGKRRAQDLWRRNDAVRALACDDNVIEFLSALYGRRAFPFQTLNFVHGSEQQAHSDTIHFSSTPAGFMCGVWIALEDVDEENGPLFYFRGSQNLPVYSLADIGGDDYVKHYEPFVADALEAGGYEKKPVPMKKGDAFIWSSNLFHGGTPIIDKARTRLSLVTHYYFDDCCYSTPLREKNGKAHIREVYDISRGTFVTQRMNGGRIRPPLLVSLAARYRNLTKQSPVS